LERSLKKGKKKMRLKRKRNLRKILKNGKASIIAYDQGIEHGPESDFNDKNVDPNYIIKIAKEGGFSGLAVGKGIAQKYYKEIRQSKVPLIVKLSAKTKLYKGEPKEEQIGTVKEAKKLKAAAVGYTIHIGSKFEPEMLEDFAKIEREAHKRGMAVMLWVYPRGRSIENEFSREILAYAARTGLELGADIVKIKYNGNQSDLKWCVKSAGKTKVVISGGSKRNEKDFANEVKKIMKSGAAGIAVGRNVWQSKKPIEISKKINKIILGE
jgi:class I fructose-bisphosphate aldolase